MKIYYLVYRLTNLVNGKIYIGCHMTKNLDDGYMGSGTRINYAKKKYGIMNFKKEILKICESADEMLAEEAKIVNEEFLKRDDVYNLICGGRGSWFFINAKKQIDEQFRNQIRKSLSKSLKRRHNTGEAKSWKDNFSWFGLKHSEDTKHKMKNSHVGKHIGNKNSQFGTCWIRNQQISKKIKKEDIEIYLRQGWLKGRV